jgi:hydrogenase maturation protease
MVHADLTEMEDKHIMILGVGNILFTDEGTGVRVAERLIQDYEFPENVSVVDGGTLGINLLGTLSTADTLIVVDAVRNGGAPGAIHRLEGDDIPKRVCAKNSLHQVDLLEALTLCQALDKVPETVILGVEPFDIETMSIELSPIIQEKVSDLIDLVLQELDRLGVRYHQKEH